MILEDCRRIKVTKNMFIKLCVVGPRNDSCCGQRDALIPVIRLACTLKQNKPKLHSILQLEQLNKS